MGRGSDAQRALAIAVLRAESADRDVAMHDAMAHVFSRLLTHLTRLLGSDACSGLFSRSVHLAGDASDVWTGLALGKTPNDAVSAMAGRLAPLAPDEAQAAATELLVCFIWLLAAFVGDDIVNRLVRDIWPALPSATDLVDREESSR